MLPEKNPLDLLTKQSLVYIVPAGFEGCSAVVHSLVQLSNSHVIEGLSPFPPDISAPSHMSATSSFHSPLSQLLRWPLSVYVYSMCVSACLVSVWMQQTREDSSLNYSVTPSSQQSLPLLSSLLAATTQPQCFVCLRLMVQKVLQELKLYHG